ncbi:hypothetical protein D3C87_324890 [compost metagenome]
MTNSAKNFFIGIGALLGLPALIAVMAIYRGYILSILWGWFLVPLGMPIITIPLAIGFTLIVGYFTTNKKPKSEEYNWGEAVAVSSLTPLLFLGIGWIVKFFV